MMTMNSIGLLACGMSLGIIAAILFFRYVAKIAQDPTMSFAAGVKIQEVRAAAKLLRLKGHPDAADILDVRADNFAKHLKED